MHFQLMSLIFYLEMCKWILWEHFRENNNGALGTLVLVCVQDQSSFTDLTYLLGSFV
jgi:hypothetical protein